MRGALLIAALFLVGVFAGCLGDEDRLRTATDDGATAPALVDLLHDVSVPDPDVRVVDQILEQVRLVAPDGVALDTWIVRPDTDAPVPLVLQVTPYYWGGPPIVDDPVEGKRHLLGRLAEELVPRGYAYAISSVRGTGNSGGCFTQGGPTEAKDTAAVIEHLAAQPWSNGRVGLIGVSYPGTTPQDVWIEAPPALKTIVPISGISDFYRYNFVNGVPIDIQGYGFNAYYWWYVGIGGPLDTDPRSLDLPPAVGHLYDPVHAPEAVRGEACTDQVAVQEGGATSTLDGNKDGYWQLRDFTQELRASWTKNPQRASVFYIHGLQDWNVKPHMMEEWLPALWESGVPLKVWLGQWPHAWPMREDWWNTTMVAWFDQFLKEVDTGILAAPAVQVQDDLGVWRHEATWPPADAALRVFHPDGDGTLGTQPGSGRVAYHDGHGVRRTAQDMLPDDATLAPVVDPMKDAVAPEVVLWVSEPLEEDLLIAGMPRFRANVSADGERAALILTLAERNATGIDRPFNYAALSLNHAKDLTQGDPDIAGETLAVDLAFFPQDDVIERGSRLVLMAAGDTVGGPGPALLAPSTGATITIDLEGARLELPIDTTRVPEAPQPCWKGAEEVAKGERAFACHRVTNR